MRARLRSTLLAALALAGLGLTACDPYLPTGEASSPPVETPAPSFDLADLLAVDVPSLCGHPAGKLVDGVLPGIAEFAGAAGLHGALLEDLHEGAETSDFAVVGADVDGLPFLAAVMSCDQGGVAWPNVVVVYDAELRPVAEFHPDELTGGDREQVAGLSATDAGFQARWTATNEYDAACCAQLSVQADITVSVVDAAVTAAEPVILRGEEQVRAVAEAALTGTTVEGIEVEEGLYEGILGIQEKGGVYDLDGIVCRDTGSSTVGTLVCGIPVEWDGEDLAFVVHPALSGVWNDYALPQFDRELW
ncbi:hypothetical protein [Microbacterium tumbae]